MVIGQSSGHRGWNPQTIGTPFNGSRGVDVWTVSNSPGNVLGQPVVWQSAGNTLRIAIPPMNAPAPNFQRFVP